MCFGKVSIGGKSSTGDGEFSGGAGGGGGGDDGGGGGGGGISGSGGSTDVTSPSMFTSSRNDSLDGEVGVSLSFGRLNGNRFAKSGNALDGGT